MKSISNHFVDLDKPKFGETVHEPPILTLPKRAKVKQFATTVRDPQIYFLLILEFCSGWHERFIIKRKNQSME